MEEKDIQAFNESMPYGELPHERIEWLINYYNDLEKKRLEAWEMVQKVRKDIESYNLQIDDSQMVSMINSTATYDGKTLKIVVDDYLPRKCIMTSKKAVTLLQDHWLKAITEAIRRLKAAGYETSFEKAFCIIKSYIPRNVERDPDNIAFKPILDGLRYSRIINTDSWDRLAFMVDGGLDRSHPRTEIYVIEYRDIIPFMVSVTK